MWAIPLRWNGKKQNGQDLPAGIYFYGNLSSPERLRIITEK